MSMNASVYTSIGRTFGFGVILAILFLFALSGTARPQRLEDSDPYKNSIAVASDANVSAAVLGRHLVALEADDISDVTNIWQRRVQMNLARIAAGLTRLDTVEDSEVPQLVAEIKAINQENIENFQKYLIVFNALARKSAPQEELDKHEHFIRGFIGELLISYDFLTIAHLSWDWIRSGRGGLRAVSGIILAGFIIVVAFFAGGLAKRISKRWYRRGEEVNEISAIVVPNAIRWGVVLLGPLVAMWSLGLSIGVATAVLGGIGFLLAFMLQNLFQSVIGGFLLQATNPYSKGDVISINQVIGTVVDVNVVATKLKTFDNRLIQIPNQAIWQGSMENLTKYRVRRVDLVFSVGYRDDLDRAKEILTELVLADERCLKTPEARVFVGELAPSSVNIFCRPWVRTSDYWDVMWDLTELGKTRLQKEEIYIAFPQLEVHVRSKDVPETLSV